jgi:outer membrane protein OmpA-like peptidoglycan-associated protein
MLSFHLGRAATLDRLRSSGAIIMTKVGNFIVIATFVAGVTASAIPARAQTIGYSEALGALGRSCGHDIDKFCSKVNLGGGKVADCLEQHWANVSPSCKSATTVVRDLIVKRREARRAVPRVCERDRLQLCGSVQEGDANLLECFENAKQNISRTCRQAVLDAGYETPLATGPVSNQVHLSSNDIVSSLQGVEDAAAAGITAAKLRQLAIQSMHDSARANRLNRPSLMPQLSNLAQMTIAIQFDFNSARIRPSSYQAIGLMADALYSPYLQGYCFLVVGNTDGVGTRDYNFKLSQQRADAIRAALINPFAIQPARIEAVGLGEENFLNPADPKAAENRRVQLINVGKLSANASCPNRPEEVLR